MVMLVALRLAIGWHFFKEGLSHRTDPTWTSEGFLKQAKGPLAAEYQAVLPKFHDWDRLILSPLPDNNAASKEEIDEAAPAKDKPADKAAADKSDKADKPAKPSTAYDDWLTQVKNDWKTEQDAFANFYKLTDEQKAQAAEIDKKSTQQMEELLKGDADDIRLYRQLVYRAQMMQAAAGGGEIPFIKNRAAVVQKIPVGEAGLAGTSAVISSSPPAWEADAKGIEKLRHMRLDDLLTTDQRKLGEQPPESAKLHKIDTAVVVARARHRRLPDRGIVYPSGGCGRGGVSVIRNLLPAAVDRRVDPNVLPSGRVLGAVGVGDDGRRAMGRARLFHSSSGQAVLLRRKEYQGTSMNLTPEERTVGKENFEVAIGGEGAFNRRSFLGTTLAATRGGAGVGAMYFNYAKEGPPKDPFVSASLASATRGKFCSARCIRRRRGSSSKSSRSPTSGRIASIARSRETIRRAITRSPARPHVDVRLEGDDGCREARQGL